jgi:prefoldin subunit 5
MEKIDELKARVEAVKTALEGAQDKISSLQQAADKIPGQLQRKQDELRQAMITGSGTSKIHADIEAIQKRKIEISSEILAAISIEATAKKEFNQATSELEDGMYSLLVKELTPRGLRIFKILDSLHIELCELVFVQDQLNHIVEISKKPAGQFPDDTVVIPVARIWHLVNQAFQIIIAYNGGLDKNRLSMNGANTSVNRLGEYSKQIEITR